MPSTQVCSAPLLALEDRLGRGHQFVSGGVYIYGASWLEWDGILRAQQVRLTEITQQTEAHVIQSLEEVSRRVSRLEAEKTVRRVLKRR